MLFGVMGARVCPIVRVPQTDQKSGVSGVRTSHSGASARST
jgi:hypothetical protein